jgi:hypothetical protein
MTMDEPKLEELYGEMAAADERRAPSFGSVMGRARRAPSARIPVVIAFGLAAMVALFVVLALGRRADVSSARSEERRVGKECTG